MDYAREPQRWLDHPAGPVADFTDGDSNLDPETVQAFGQEWERFGSFDPQEVEAIGDEYFDVLTPADWNGIDSALDVGCGSGRWSRYLATRVKNVEAIDPSDAWAVAQHGCQDLNNVRVSKASVTSIPFKENSFDLVICLGVLHHVPDTQAALSEVCKAIKPGGRIVLYLYYNLEQRSGVTKALLGMVNTLRKGICRLPHGLRNAVCDLLAVVVYLPLVTLARLGKKLGANVEGWPLSYYCNKSWLVMRNDARDRFGTPLEQRFSRNEIADMLQAAGMEAPVFSENAPFWHCLSQKPGH